MKKNEALKKWAKELDSHTITVKWLDSILKGREQATTIEDLERGIKEGHISVRDALIFALIVGVQWHEKFEGVP